jgi:hypothetical protein
LLRSSARTTITQCRIVSAVSSCSQTTGACSNTKRIPNWICWTVTPDFGASTRGDNTTVHTKPTLGDVSAFSNLRGRSQHKAKHWFCRTYGSAFYTGRPMRMRLTHCGPSFLQLEAFVTNHTTARDPIATSAQSSKGILVTKTNNGTAQRRITTPAGGPRGQQ